MRWLRRPIDFSSSISFGRRPSRPARARSWRDIALCVRDELFRNLRLRAGSTFAAHVALAPVFDQNLVALQKLLHLDHVIGEAIPSRYRSPSARRQLPRWVAALVRFASDSNFAAPVNCSAMRKSDAWRTPLTRPFFIGMTVGRPAPAHKRDMVEAHFEGAIDSEGAAEAHAAEHAELARRSMRRRTIFEKIFVPTDRDAVLGDAAEAGHDAFIELFVDFRDVAQGREGHAPAERFDARDIGAAAARSLGRRPP